MCRYYNEGEITVVPACVVARIYGERIGGTFDYRGIYAGAVIAAQKFSA